MTHYRLIASGRVQGVGYRALVKQVALGLKVKGVVRNLSDTVEIFCECSPETLEKFKEGIEIKGDLSNIFSPYVENIEAYEKGHKNYENAPVEVGLFEIDYCIEMRPVEKESLERSEIGILALSGVRSDIKDMHTDLKEGFKDTKEGLDSVEDAISGMHSDMNVRFDTLDEKYGEFGEKMTTLEHNIGDLTWQIKRLVDHVVGEETKENKA